MILLRSLFYEVFITGKTWVQCVECDIWTHEECTDCCILPAIFYQSFHVGSVVYVSLYKKVYRFHMEIHRMVLCKHFLLLQIDPSCRKKSTSNFPFLKVKNAKCKKKISICALPEKIIERCIFTSTLFWRHRTVSARIAKSGLWLRGTLLLKEKEKPMH